LIKESGEFVINLPNRKMVRAVDFCGVVSGKDCNKFQSTGLTPIAAKNIKAPIIQEAPLSLECRVTSITDLGSHHLFLAKVVGVLVDDYLMDQTGRLNLAKAELISYVHGHYWTLKEAIGSFGFSVKKHYNKKK
jgi:flavin reductase (DIM6/NTAB) family NADH-FMN oxidoreductase RutF